MRFLSSLLASVFCALAAEAQVSAPEVHHVRWPLLDIVMVPDSAELWFVAGAESRNHELGVRQQPGEPGHRSDSRAPMGHHRPPAHAADGRSLPDSVDVHTAAAGSGMGPGFILLGTNTKKASADRAFIFLVSDSARAPNGRRSPQQRRWTPC